MNRHIFDCYSLMNLKGIKGMDEETDQLIKTYMNCSLTGIWPGTISGTVNGDYKSNSTVSGFPFPESGFKFTNVTEPNTGQKISLYKEGFKTLAGLNLNQSSFNLLLHVIENMVEDTAEIECSPTKLAKILNLSKSQISRIKSKLVKANVIIKRDGREYINSHLAWYGKEYRCQEQRHIDPQITIPDVVIKTKRRNDIKVETLPYKLIVISFLFGIGTILLLSQIPN
jgi:predicted transcriptional regulator